MPTRVAINGFGRIGRQAFKIASRRPELEIVAINDVGDLAKLEYPLKYESVHRKDDQDLRADGDTLIVDGRSFPVLKVSEPTQLPWRDLNVDVVIESTGRFTKRDQAAVHLESGARSVVISAPASGAPSFVLGVNEETYDA